VTAFVFYEARLGAERVFVAGVVEFAVCFIEGVGEAGDAFADCFERTGVFVANGEEDGRPPMGC
jgi:hypothetical protein